MLRSALVALALVPAAALLAAGPAAAQSAPEDPIVRKLAAHNTSLDFADAPLPTVVAFLAKQTGVNMVLDAELRRNNEEEDVRINLSLRDVPATTALNLICRLADIEWRVRQGVVWFAEPGTLVGPTELQEYDVRDLVNTPKDHAAPFRDLFTALTSNTGMEDEGEEYGLHPEELEELIRGTIEPESWDHPNASITQIGGTLIIKAPAEVHRAIAGMLRDLRAVRNVQVAMEVTVVEASPAVARALRAGMTNAPALSAEADAALAAALKRGDAVLLSRASLSGYNTQQVALRDGTQLRLTMPTGAPATEAVVHDGLTAQIRPALVGGAGTVHLRARVQYAGAHATTAEHAGLDVVTVDTALVAPLNATLLLGGGSHGAASSEAARETLVLVRVSTPGEQPIPLRYGPGNAASDAAVATRAKLSAKRITCDFAGTPLLEVAAFLQDASGVNIVVGEGVFDDRPEAELQVNLQVNDVTALEALQLIGSLLRLRLALHADHCIFNTRMNRGDTALAIYDLRDLEQPPVYAPAMTADLNAVPGQLTPARDEGPEAFTVDQFADLIREAVDPESWDTPPNSLEARPGFLIARNAPGNLTEMDDVLRRLRRATHRAVLVEALFLEVTEAEWKERGLGRVLTPAQAADVARAAGAGELKLAAAGRVTGLNSQRFSLHAGRQLATFGKAGPLFAADGVVVDVVPVCAGDDRHVHCAVDVRRHRAAAKGGLRPGLPAQTLRTQLKVPSGGAIALGRFGVPGAPGSLLVLRVTPAKKQ
jgi:hypothetical protein